MGNNSEGARKGVITLRKKHGKVYFTERARKAGKASAAKRQLVLDPATASAMGKLGAAKRWGNAPYGKELGAQDG